MKVPLLVKTDAGVIHITPLLFTVVVPLLVKVGIFNVPVVTVSVPLLVNVATVATLVTVQMLLFTKEPFPAILCKVVVPLLVIAKLEATVALAVIKFEPVGIVMFVETVDPFDKVMMHEPAITGEVFRPQLLYCKVAFVTLIVDWIV